MARRPPPTRSANGFPSSGSRPRWTGCSPGRRATAAASSTGEQKALLLGLVLAHADLVADRRGAAPILLLDEVAAHLDPKRRAALFARLEGRGQVWMTATEAALFDGIAAATRFHVSPGAVAAE
jgi:DNA replication and repair protein RecF